MSYDVDPLLGCHIWTGGCNSAGYPIMRVRGRVVLARRHFYEQERGAIASGYDLRSTCEVKRCVNVAHLEPMEASLRRRLPRRRRRTSGGG